MELKTIIEIIAGLGTVLSVLKQLKDMRDAQAEMIRQQTISGEQLKNEIKLMKEEIKNQSIRLDEHNNLNDTIKDNYSEIRNSITRIETDIKWLKEGK